jgi:hypothetical protein
VQEEVKIYAIEFCSRSLNDPKSMNFHIHTLGILILNTIHLVHVDKELENMSLTQLGVICGPLAQSLPEEGKGKCSKTKF